MQYISQMEDIEISEGGIGSPFLSSLLQLDANRVKERRPPPWTPIALIVTCV